MPQTQASPYVITYKTPEGIVQQTRMMAASAVVLAMKLREAGHADVEVADAMGNLLTPEAYEYGRLSEAGDRRPYR